MHSQSLNTFLWLIVVPIATSSAVTIGLHSMDIHHNLTLAYLDGAITFSAGVALMFVVRAIQWRR